MLREKLQYSMAATKQQGDARNVVSVHFFRAVFTFTLMISDLSWITAYNFFLCQTPLKSCIKIRGFFCFCPNRSVSFQPGKTILARLSLHVSVIGTKQLVSI